MATSPVEICNQALGWLGGDLIISLDDDTVEAKLCKANYESLRDAVLEEREWTFAVSRIQLNKLTSEPIYGFSGEFQIPTNVIRILQVSKGAVGLSAVTRGGTGMGNESRTDWVREGQLVLSDEAALFARVLIKITDTTKFSPAFDQALAARVAMDLAIPLTNSARMQQDMARMYGEKIRIAASSDGMQGRSFNVRSDSLTVVR